MFYWNTATPICLKRKQNFNQLTVYCWIHCQCGLCVTDMVMAQCPGVFPWHCQTAISHWTHLALFPTSDTNHPQLLPQLNGVFELFETI